MIIKNYNKYIDELNESNSMENNELDPFKEDDWYETKCEFCGKIISSEKYYNKDYPDHHPLGKLCNVCRFYQIQKDNAEELEEWDDDEQSDFLSESKLNGKYGFFMFLDIIDELKNSFIKEDYLNVRDFNLFFTTDKINDKNKLSDIIEYKKSLDVAFETLNHIKNLRLSFYFGIRDYNIEYGFHDDLKRMVYKIGEFKITSSYLKSLKSYKCITLISKVLKESNLKDLELLQKIKMDLKYLFDQKFNDIEIKHGDKIIKKINNTELKNYYNKENITEYFDSWSLKHKWYYKTYNYTDVEGDETYFYVKVKENDEGLKVFKKYDKDMKKLQEAGQDKESDSFNDIVPRTVVAEPMITEPLEAPKSKMFNGVKKNDGKTMKKIDKEKELIKYYKDLKRIIFTVNKDILKDNSYVTKHLYKIVGQYKKPFNDVKKDIQWLTFQLRKNQYFIEQTEGEFKDKLEKDKIKQKKLKDQKSNAEKKKAEREKKNSLKKKK